MKIKKYELYAKIKRSKLIRLLLYPVGSIERKVQTNKYIISGYGSRICGLKDSYKGKRCFIIGNGPSLKSEDLEKIKGEFSFAANRIFLMFDKTKWRPTFYSIVDSNVFNEVKDFITNIEAKCIFVDWRCNFKNSKFDYDRTYFICSKTKFYIDTYKADPPFISECPDQFISDGKTVTFAEIQLALYMGFNEIYLIGVDHSFSKKLSQNHFEGDNSALNAPPNLIVPTKAYQVAREYCDTHNIKIYNATRGGKLEVFERIDFDNIFEECE